MRQEPRVCARGPKESTRKAAETPLKYVAVVPSYSR